MDPLFLFIESSAFSTFIRESPSLWVFPFILILHTVGLAFFIGVNLVWDVRILGVAALVPLASLERYVRIMWLGFWINAVSGVLLLIAYPTKAMTNPVFYLKLTLIAVGLAGALHIRKHLAATRDGVDLPNHVRTLAAASLACWVAVIFAGRFLAYTCTRLTVEFPC